MIITEDNWRNISDGSYVIYECRDTITGGKFCISKNFPYRPMFKKIFANFSAKDMWPIDFRFSSRNYNVVEKGKFMLYRLEHEL